MEGVEHEIQVSLRGELKYTWKALETRAIREECGKLPVS
jgi:hypothetical protein